MAYSLFMPDPDHGDQSLNHRQRFLAWRAAVPVEQWHGAGRYAVCYAVSMSAFLAVFWLVLSLFGIRSDWWLLPIFAVGYFAISFSFRFRRLGRQLRREQAQAEQEARKQADLLAKLHAAANAEAARKAKMIVAERAAQAQRTVEQAIEAERRQAAALARRQAADTPQALLFSRQRHN